MMATLTVEQIKTLRRQVGSTPDDAELQSIYDRTASLDETALEILETRLADFQANPAQFAVAGEYSQSTAENIRSLQAAIEALIAAADEEETGPSVVRIVRPACRPAR